MEEKNNFRVMKDLQGYFKEGEREKLYNSADNLRDKTLIRLLWITGRRINEILNIKVGEIDFEKHNLIIHVEKKTKSFKNQEGIKSRIKDDLLSLSYMDSFTISLLKLYIIDYKLNRTDYLFKSSFKDNKPITRQRAFNILKRLGKKTGVNSVGNKGIHPHHFRHTYAIDVAKKMKTPADVRKLQILMDHSSLAVTEQYLKFSDKEVSELIDNLYDIKKV
jgi:integrase